MELGPWTPFPYADCNSDRFYHHDQMAWQVNPEIGFVSMLYHYNLAIHSSWPVKTLRQRAGFFGHVRESVE